MCHGCNTLTTVSANRNTSRAANFATADGGMTWRRRRTRSEAVPAAPAFLVAGGAARYTVRRSRTLRGRNSVGRMPASQAGRRRFESGRPLSLQVRKKERRTSRAAPVPGLGAVCFGAHTGAHDRAEGGDDAPERERWARRVNRRRARRGAASQGYPRGVVPVGKFALDGAIFSSSSSSFSVRFFISLTSRVNRYCAAVRLPTEHDRRATTSRDSKPGRAIPPTCDHRPTDDAASAATRDVRRDPQSLGVTKASPPRYTMHDAPEGHSGASSLHASSIFVRCYRCG